MKGTTMKRSIDEIEESRKKILSRVRAQNAQDRLAASELGLEGSASDCIAMREQIVDTADSDVRLNGGDWECWKMVFQYDLDMLRRFQEAMNKKA